MEKIILKDGTEYEILSGATQYNFSVAVHDMNEVSRIVEKLTPDNLSYFTLQLEYTTIIVQDKVLNMVSAALDASKDFAASFELRNVNATEKDIYQLQTDLQKITAENLLYDSVVKMAQFSLIATLSDGQALQVSNLYPVWTPDGHYKTGDRYTYKEILYKCLQDHDGQESWTPEDAPSLWAKVLIPDPEVIPEWEQPESTNGYNIGDKVTHNDKVWKSLVDNNIWEPGVIGTESLWVEVTEESDS